MEAQKPFFDEISVLKNLPTLPHILLKLFEASSRERVNLDEIAAIVSKDPSLSINVLKLVNSNYFGLSSKIYEINRAVNLIGISGIKNMAICACVYEAFSKNMSNGSFNLKLFWWHSLRCGAYDYLRKPFEFEEFLRTVENALNQKALKREKDKINEKLILSEEKYRYLIENSPNIIYTLDADGNFTFLSEALEHLMGFTVDGLIGKHYTTIVYEEDRDKAQWFFDERRSRDRAASAIELRLKAAGEEQFNDSVRRYVTVEIKSMGIYEESTNNEARRYVVTHGVIRDISERQRLQAQLQNAERMESLGTLAGGALRMILTIC